MQNGEFTRRPLVGLTLCYLCGTVLGFTQDAALRPLIAGAAAFWILAVLAWTLGNFPRRASDSFTSRCAVFSNVSIFACVVLLAWASAVNETNATHTTYVARNSIVSAECDKARRRAAHYLSFGIKEHDDAVGLLHALALGYRGRLSENNRRVFVQTGTLHIFAVSGLHVVMICWPIIFVLKAFRVSRVYWVLILAPLLIFYTVMTGASASAVRACIMAITCFLAPLLGRKADALSAVALAALLILIVSPGQIFGIGFILSFLVVIGLILLYPIFYAVSPLNRLCETDAYIADGIEMDGRDMEELSRWERAKLLIVPVLQEHVGHPFLRHVNSLICASCAAWLVSAPLTAYFFGRFPPIALLANLVVIPLSFLVILCGCLSLVLGSCALWFADVFNHANLALITILVKSTEMMSAVPFSSIDVPGLPVWAILLWYLALHALMMRLRMLPGVLMSRKVKPTVNREPLNPTT